MGKQLLVRVFGKIRKKESSRKRDYAKLCKMLNAEIVIIIS